MINKITIIGVGLIGGSLALALKERNLAKAVFGYGRDQTRLEEAQKSNVIDAFSTNIKEAIDEANIIVIATPVGTFKDILHQIEPLISSNVIITDVGSTKSDIVNIVEGRMEAKGCVSKSGSCTGVSGRCLTHDLWDELSRHIELFLGQISLKDIIAGNVLGRSSPPKVLELK